MTKKAPPKLPWRDGKYVWEEFTFNIKGSIEPTSNMPPIPGLWGFTSYPQILTSMSPTVEGDIQTGQPYDANASIMFDEYQKAMIDIVGYQCGWWEIDITLSYSDVTLTSATTITLHNADSSMDVVMTGSSSQTVVVWSVDQPVDLGLNCMTADVGINYASSVQPQISVTPLWSNMEGYSLAEPDMNLTVTLKDTGWEITLSPFYFKPLSGPNAVLTYFDPHTFEPSVDKDGNPTQFLKFTNNSSTISDLPISPYNLECQTNGYANGYGTPYMVNLSATLSPSLIESIKEAQERPIVAFTGGHATAYTAIQTYFAPQLPADSGDRAATYSDRHWAIPQVPLDCPDVLGGETPAAAVKSNWTAVATILREELNGVRTAQTLFNNINDILLDVYSNNILTIDEIITFFKLTESGPVAKKSFNFFDFFMTAVSDVMMSVAVVAPELKVGLTLTRTVLGIVQAGIDAKSSSFQQQDDPAAYNVSIFEAQNSLESWFVGLQSQIGQFYADLTAYTGNLRNLGNLDSAEFSITASHQQAIVSAMSRHFAVNTFSNVATQSMSLKRYRACSTTDPETQGPSQFRLDANSNGLFPYKEKVTLITTNESNPDVEFWSKVMLNQANGDLSVYNAQNDGSDAQNPVNFTQEAYDWLTKGVSRNWSLMSDYQFFNLNKCKLPINADEGYPLWDGYAGPANIT